MDSQNPHQREYQSQPASRQDAQAASPSSARHTPAYTDPPMSYQPTRMTAGAPTDIVHQSETHSPPVKGGDGGEDDDDGPITVPVLGIQPIRQEWKHAPDDDTAHQIDQDIRPSWPEDEQGDNQDDDALNAFDVDIALGFGAEPIPREDAFAFRERSWDSWKRTRKTALTLLALVAMLAVAIIGATFAASFMRPATQGLSITPSQPTVSSYSGGLVIQGPEAIAPTPEAPKYQIGAWMSNNAPSGGSVKVFVRVTENVKPLAHVSVTLTAQVPGGTLRYGPTKTDGYGLATFEVRYGGLSQTPVFVTATAKVDKQTTLSADTVFVPI